MVKITPARGARLSSAMGSSEGSRSLEASVPKKFRPMKDTSGSGGGKSGGGNGGNALNWTMCVLCVTSLGVSGLLAYRELRLEERVASLESMCHMKMVSGAGGGGGVDEEVFVKRVQREVKLLVEEAQKQQQQQQGQAAAAAALGPDVFRLKRDTLECNCPPGGC